MYTTEIAKDTTYYLDIFVTDSNGEPVTGLTVGYALYKSFDNSLVTSGTLIEVGGGVYQQSYTFGVLGQFRVIYNTPTGYEDGIETILVTEGKATQGTVDSLIAMVTRILGLTHENYRLFDITFDDHDNLLTATAKIYPTANDCENDTNATAEYEIESTYDIHGRLIDYQMRRVA